MRIEDRQYNKKGGRQIPKSQKDIRLLNNYMYVLYDFFDHSFSFIHSYD